MTYMPMPFFIPIHTTTPTTEVVLPHWLTVFGSIAITGLLISIIMLAIFVILMVLDKESETLFKIVGVTMMLFIILMIMFAILVMIFGQ